MKGQRAIRSWDVDTLATPVEGSLYDGIQALAQMMAQPLRNAFRDHLLEHEHPNGFGACTEAMRLYNLMPAGDQAPSRYVPPAERWIAYGSVDLAFDPDEPPTVPMAR